MANTQLRLTQNISGAFYVDDSCIDCDLCRETAPNFFRRNGDIGMSVVYRQPLTPEEISQAAQALHGCPSESIGDDGAPA
jgi:ferredoxin